MLRAGHDVSCGGILHQGMYFETPKEDRKENKNERYHAKYYLTVRGPEELYAKGEDVVE